MVSSLARELSKNHRVDVFHSDPLSDVADYSVTEKKFDGYVGWEVKKDVRKITSFQETYIDEKIEDVFENKIKELKPDVVHFHHLLHLSCNLPKIAKKYKIPIVLTLHDFWFQCFAIKRVDLAGKMCDFVDINKCEACIKRKIPLNYAEKKIIQKIRNENFLKLLKKAYFIKEQIKNFLINKKDSGEIQIRNKKLMEVLLSCDLVIAPTKFLHNEFLKWGLKEGKLIYSADGIEDTHFRDNEKNKSDKFRFAFIGSIVPEKGLEVAVDAFNKISDLNCLLYIYGDLNYDKRYSDVIKKKSGKNKKIIFKGTFAPEKIGKVFKDIDCLIMPSVWAENSPLVVKNAILAKTPVLASDIPGVWDMIKNNHDGLLFKMGNAEDLTDKMKKILDEKEYSRIKKNIAPIKTTKENAEELVIIYKKLIKNGQ